MFAIRPYRRRRPPLPMGSLTYHAAMADAAREVPRGSEPAEWVQALYRACSGWAENLAAGWCRADQRLLTRWLSLQAALQHAVAELGRSRGAEEARAAERAAQAQLRPELQNPMGDSLTTGQYLAGVILVAALEFPLVYLSFNAFGLAAYMTGLLSLLSAVITAILGHALGTVSRHLRVRTPLMLGILLALSVGFALSLAWLRESALAAVTSETATLDPKAAALALFVISLASLAVVAILAWHHGVDPADRELHKARLLRRRLERQVERLRRELITAETGRSAAREMARQDVLAAGEAMLATAHRYARFNQLQRDKHDLPAALLDENLPRLAMPVVLQQPLIWVSQELPL